MKITDLSHTIRPDMPVYPGTGQPELTDAFTFEKHGFREKKICMFSHTGTHMDAPAHMLTGGACLDELEAACFAGDAIIIDAEGTNGEEISFDCLKPFGDKLKRVDFVIIKTGWSRYWGNPRYFKEFPYLDTAAVQWLSDFRLKGIGIDTISIDRAGSREFTAHKTLLARNILIIENLTNLDAVKSEIFSLFVLPLKLQKADGAPVRAVCIEGI